MAITYSQELRFNKIYYYKGDLHKNYKRLLNAIIKRGYKEQILPYKSTVLLKPEKTVTKQNLIKFNKNKTLKQKLTKFGIFCK